MEKKQGPDYQSRSVRAEHYVSHLKTLKTSRSVYWVVHSFPRASLIKQPKPAGLKQPPRTVLARLEARSQRELCSCGNVQRRILPASSQLLVVPGNSCLVTASLPTLASFSSGRLPCASVFSSHEASVKASPSPHVSVSEWLFF